MEITHYIKEFFNSQLKNWEFFSNTFQNLEILEKREFSLGDFRGFILYNPARVRSTAADVSQQAIKARKCFLCSENRPPEQISMELSPGWTLLVNPFPVFPYHFTIASTSHLPQKFDFRQAFKLSHLLPGFCVFYNDDGAGASAPDHNHYQAVPSYYLPLVSIIAPILKNKKPGIFLSEELRLNLPFEFISAKIDSTVAHDEIFSQVKDILNIKFPKRPINAYFVFQSPETCIFIIIPRKAHRPECFYSTTSSRRQISPGAIDMAGGIITPRLDDFQNLTESEILTIYRQVAYENESRWE